MTRYKRALVRGLRRSEVRGGAEHGAVSRIIFRNIHPCLGDDLRTLDVGDLDWDGVPTGTDRNEAQRRSRRKLNSGMRSRFASGLIATGDIGMGSECPCGTEPPGRKGAGQRLPQLPVSQLLVDSPML